MTTQAMLAAAKAATAKLATLSTAQKNQLLLAMADALVANSAAILAENTADMEAAKGKLSDVMLDRLLLTEARIAAMADGIRAVAELADPVGAVLGEHIRTDGMTITKIAVPFGVVAIIYESRPNVTSDAAALCIKSGNVCVLRSGKDAYRSAHAICETLRAAIAKCGYPRDFVCMVDDPTRQSATDLMTAKGFVDLLIPRGGAGLIRSVVENATVPCIETGTGICHIYVDAGADVDMAISILDNAKTSRPSVCNAAEVVLVHREIANEFLSQLYLRLVRDRMRAGIEPVELRLDARAAKYISGTAATDSDFHTEFLDYILAVKIVDTAADAVAHIAAHSTGHSEAIVTGNPSAADFFVQNVNSAAVYVNASTRFTDGGEFGFGCEMGISTQKLHARGPMGLPELCTYKYVIKGNGNIR